MKNQILRKLFVLLAISVVFVSCSKDDNDGGGQNPTTGKKVRYELSGTFTGRLNMVTATNSGNLQEFLGFGVPFTKEIAYPNSVLAAGASLQTTNEFKGTPGQTVIIKVFMNNTLKETLTLTADAEGSVNAPLAFYTF